MEKFSERQVKTIDAVKQDEITANIFETLCIYKCTVKEAFSILDNVRETIENSTDICVKNANIQDLK